MRPHRFVLTAAALLVFLAPPARAQTTSALLDSLQRTGFQFFWNEASPTNGLIRDRSTSGSPCSIASTGFGLSAICIGVDHGWVSRTAAADRVLTTLETFWNGPQGSATSGTIGYKGLFYHFLDMTTATRTWDSELSTIDTALLLAGVLDAGEYFDGAGATETQIRALSDSINDRVDWNFMRNYNPGILMGWKPGTGFAGFGQWIGYNEAMILYLLALGSPTHPVPASAWTQWTSGYLWDTYYGQSYVIFPPLFGHQYSHCWVDFRDRRDPYMTAKGIDYFENSRRATLAQRAYCIANPGGWVGYSDSLWGITASDVPTGYNARGAPPAMNDDGTITPTAPISSIPFTPDESIAVIHYLWDHEKAQLWGPYGFRDAFNPTVNWWDTDVLGIDQGPIVLMIENYLNGRVWQRMKSNPTIVAGLQNAGFTIVTAVHRPEEPSGVALALAGPNPFSDGTRVSFSLPRAGHVRLTLFDVQGRRVATVLDGERPAGPQEVAVRVPVSAAGVLVLRLETGYGTRSLRLVRIR